MTEISLVDIAFTLKRCDLFLHLDLENLLPIAKKLGIASFKAGSPIFREGEEADHMFLVVDGAIKIFSKKRSRISSVDSLEFFGEESFFNGRPRAYTAIAKEKSLCFTLTRSNIFAIISEFPSVSIALLEEYSNVTECRFL